MARSVLKNMKPAVLICAGLLGGCAGEPVAWVNPGTGEGVGQSGSGQIPALLRVASATAAAGDYGTAIGLFRRAHSLDEQQMAPLLGLGRALLAVDDYNQAAETFGAALKIDPGNDEALRGLGNALIGLDKPKAAASQFEAALMLHDGVKSYNGLGVAYDLLGEHKTAQAIYRAGLDMAPDDLSLLNNLGLSLTFSGSYDDAIAVLTKAARHPDAGSRNRLNLALAYGVSGDTKTAGDLARLELDETQVQGNLTYYRTLREMTQSRTRTLAVGAHLVDRPFMATPPKLPQ